MKRYSKAIAAVLGVIISKAALALFGIDFQSMGVGPDLAVLLDGAIVTIVAGWAVERAPANKDA